MLRSAKIEFEEFTHRIASPLNRGGLQNSTKFRETWHAAIYRCPVNDGSLHVLARFLSTHPAVVEKAAIQQAYGHALEVSGNIRLGDDCAALPNPYGSGHLLFAAEGMPQTFVEDDPWFAGYSAIMLNLSDIAAMGGRPFALTDILWSPSDEISSQIWQGMQAAAHAYGVPIVGGHTTHTGPGSGKTALGAAVLGHAGDRLITSFDAKPGDHLVIAIDMHGGYRANGRDGGQGILGLQRDVLPRAVESGPRNAPRPGGKRSLPRRQEHRHRRHHRHACHALSMVPR